MNVKRLRTVMSFSVAAAAVALAPGCSKPARHGIPSEALDHAIGAAIGDPNTCVLLADRTSGKIVYSYGAPFNCVRGLPACDRPGYLSARQSLTFGSSMAGRETSCPSNEDGSRTVGWAEGKVASRTNDLIYSAMMEGQTAMPGHEIASRLFDAFQQSGL